MSQMSIRQSQGKYSYQSESSATYDCPICMTTNTRQLLQLPCGHKLCLKCLHMICAHSTLACPFCRRRLSTWLRHNPDYSTLIIRKRGRPRKYIKENQLKKQTKPKKSKSKPKRTYRTSKPKPTIDADGNIDSDWLLAKQIRDQDMEEFRYYYGRVTRSMSKKVDDVF